MTQQLHSHQFENGLVLVAEPMDWLESAAFAVLLPAGYTRDPDGKLGLANFACELIQRGSADRDNRQFVEDLDRLGTDRSASVAASHSSFGAATLAENLFPSLQIFTDMILQPHFPEDEVEDARQVCLQELFAAEDELAQRTIQRLRHRHYGSPYGRRVQGDEASIRSFSRTDAVDFFRTHYRPDKAILSVAGKFEWPKLKDHIGSLLSEWQSVEVPDVTEHSPVFGYEHIPFESSQTHIAVAFPSIPYADPNYFQARGAVGVLSDGMSSRLFTEVRENRGLCYTVYASCHSLKQRGSVVAYSSTSTDRAQETLDVLLHELTHLFEGIEQGELDRLKARLKSSVVMQQESCAARCSSLASDWYHLRHMMTMDEIKGIIDGLTCESINHYLANHPPERFTVVTLGEKQLEVGKYVS
ncbi:MAG: insulinase family protein [Planctomycetales bacterium]|nr:insulinase family protein [Planctomycetales bacterium]